jgi:FdhD protein
MSTTRGVPVRNWRADQLAGGPVDDRIAAEVPVALTYNRVSHVVMMATPADLEDFGLGFSVTEGLIGVPADLLATRIIPRPGGLELAMTITEDWFDRLATHRRNMAGRTGCGLCGAENIEQALRYPEPVRRTVSVRNAALQRAVGDLVRYQPLQAPTARPGARSMAKYCRSARTSDGTTRWTS